MADLINKQEFKYLLLAGGFAFVWFLWIVPNLQKWGLADQSPYVQFLLFNLGIFVFLQFFLKGQSLGDGFHLKTALALVILFIALDIWIPPLSVNTDGTLSSGGPMLVESSSDYTVGYFWTNMGITGPIVYYLTYLFTPILMLLIAGIIHPNFVRKL